MFTFYVHFLVTLCSFSKKRWQTIHTVCLDLISPEVGKDQHNGSLNTLPEKLTPVLVNKAQSVIETKNQEYSLFEQHFGNLSTLPKVRRFSFTLHIVLLFIS